MWSVTSFLLLFVFCFLSVACVEIVMFGETDWIGLSNSPKETNEFFGTTVSRPEKGHSCFYLAETFSPLN